MATPSRALLKDRAYGTLKDSILRGEFGPGTFLSERQLSGLMAMSKTPIRAAVERLELEGFLTVSPQQGIVVREISLAEIADQFEIRSALETFVARTLAGRLTPEQAERVQRNLEAQRATLEGADVERSVTLDTEFHLMFCEFLGNGEILRVMHRLRDTMHRTIRKVNEHNAPRLRESLEEHASIVEAILAGDAAAASARMESHLEYGKQRLLSGRHS